MNGFTHHLHGWDHRLVRYGNRGSWPVRWDDGRPGAGRHFPCSRQHSRHLSSGENMKKSANALFPTQQLRQMTCWDWPNPRRWLTQNCQIPRKMTYREWPNPGRWLTENGQIPRKMTYREWPNPGRWLTILRLAKSRLRTSRIYRYSAKCSKLFKSI